MLDDIIKSNLGAITVETEQNRGHPPEWWAERLTERICGISENAAPHVRQQSEAFKLAIYETILYHIKQAINRFFPLIFLPTIQVDALCFARFLQ